MVFERYTHAPRVDYLAGTVDLNRDGTDEWLAYITGPGTCGMGGCPLLVIDEGETGPVLLGALTITKLPIGVYESTGKDWLDLAVAVGGGGRDYGMVRVPFDGQRYASNPSMPPAQRSTDDFVTIFEWPDID